MVLTNNLVLYIMVQNDTSKKGGTLRGLLRIKREREGGIGVF